MPKRRTRIDFERPDDGTTPRDQRGHPALGFTWAGCANAVMEQQRQTETDQDPQTTSEAVYVFDMLYRCDLKPTTDWRIVVQDGPGEVRRFNIISVDNVRATNRRWLIRGIEDTSPRETNPQPQETP